MARCSEWMGWDGRGSAEIVFCSVGDWAAIGSVSSCGARWLENCNSLYFVAFAMCPYVMHGLGLERNGEVLLSPFVQSSKMDVDPSDSRFIALLACQCCHCDIIGLGTGCHDVAI